MNQKYFREENSPIMSVIYLRCTNAHKRENMSTIREHQKCTVPRGLTLYTRKPYLNDKKDDIQMGFELCIYTQLK
jgi:hypothetical protein